MISKVLLVTFILGASLLAGCSKDYSGDTYESRSVGEVSRTDKGVVTSMRKIKIESEEGPGAGALLGGVGGALAGSMFGKGGGKVLGAAAGAVLGGVAGNAIQNRSKDGYEYAVKLDNGSTVTVTQGVDPKISVGQRVLVVNSNKGRSRVVPE